MFAHRHRFLPRALRRFFLSPQRDLDATLTSLSETLGLTQHTSPDTLLLRTTTASPPSRTTRSTLRARFMGAPPTAIRIHPTDSLTRNIYYAAGMDGPVEPGEIIWITTTHPDELPGHPLGDHALLVVGHTPRTILGLMITQDRNDAAPESPAATSISIGAGPWGSGGHSSYVHLEYVIEIPEIAITRHGTTLPRPRFERIAERLRSDYGWS